LGPQYRRSFPEGRGGRRSGRGVKLTPYIRLMPRLRMSGAIPLFHPHAILAWAGTSSVMMIMMMMMIKIIIIRRRRRRRRRIEEIWILFSRSFLFGNVTITCLGNIGFDDE